jgi:predicted HTH domain antitoxin
MATIDIPEEINRDEAKLYLAMKLFEEGKMSLGQASYYAGFSKKAFVEILGKHKIPAIDYPAEEIERDLKNV